MTVYHIPSTFIYSALRERERERETDRPVADLGGVRGVQMHPPLVASLSINVVLHTLPAGSSNNNQH